GLRHALRASSPGIFSAPAAFHPGGRRDWGGATHTSTGVNAMNTPMGRTQAAPAVLLREARLRAEFAGEYPELQADVWMRSGELAERLVNRSHARRRQGLFTRTFDPRHFQFRGGDFHAGRSAVGR